MDSNEKMRLILKELFRVLGGMDHLPSGYSADIYEKMEKKLNNKVSGRTLYKYVKKVQSGQDINLFASKVPTIMCEEILKKDNKYENISENALQVEIVNYFIEIYSSEKSNIHLNNENLNNNLQNTNRSILAVIKTIILNKISIPIAWLLLGFLTLMTTLSILCYLISIHKNNESVILFSFETTAADKIINESKDIDELWMSGNSLEYTLKRTKEHIKIILQNGGKVRIMLLDPESYAARYCYKNIQSTDGLMTLRKTHIEEIYPIIKEIKLIANNSTGELEVKLVDFPVSERIIVINPQVDEDAIKNNKPSFVHVEYYPYDESGIESIYVMIINPKISNKLTKSKHPFNFYVSKFDDIFARGKPFNIPN